MDARCFVTSHIRLYTDANFLYLYLIVRPDTCYFLVTNYDTRLTSFFLSLFLTFVFELFFFFFWKINLRNKKFSLAKYRSVRNNFIRRISFRTDISRKRDKSIYVERNKRGTFELNSRSVRVLLAHHREIRVVGKMVGSEKSDVVVIDGGGVDRRKTRKRRINAIG